MQEACATPGGVPPEQLMAIVRKEWAANVCAAGARQTGSDAPVVAAFRRAWDTTSNGQSISPDTAAKRAVQDSSEYREAHKKSIISIFSSICGHMPAPEVISQLAQMEDATEVAEAVVNMQDTSDKAESTPEEAEGSSVVHIAEAHDVPEPPEDKHEKEVDTDWMDAFAQAYGRDPMVHEYVLLRPLDIGLTEAASLHTECMHGMMRVFKQFLDTNLTEADFVKAFVPQILTEGMALVSRVRADALQEPQYRKAMLGRLSHLHAVLCGETLSEREADFLFDTQVKGKELPLDTDELNSLVIDFVNVGETIRRDIKGIFAAYLQRDAEVDEVEAWIPACRMTEGATERLKEQLADSHEFHSVLSDAISSQSPSMSRRDIFKTMAHLLHNCRAQLLNLSCPQDLQQIIAANLQHQDISCSSS